VRGGSVDLAVPGRHSFADPMGVVGRSDPI